MSSINTNLSAMTALQALKATQSAMSKNQNQISTGLRVGEAADNASYWSIATSMKSDNGALGAVKDSIKQSKAMINTFTSAMDKSLTYLNKMKEGLVAASQPGADLNKIQTEFKANIEGMKSAANSASFNGQNWLSGASGNVELVTSYDGVNNKVGTLSINTSQTNLVGGPKAILNDALAIDISATAATVNTGTNVATLAGANRTEGSKLTAKIGDMTVSYTFDAADAADADWSTALGKINTAWRDATGITADFVTEATNTLTIAPTGGASGLKVASATFTDSLSKSLADIDAAIASVTEGSAMLGANKALLETQESFIGVLSDNLTAGVSAFVDADMNEASTRNQALQTQQQLGVQALSMANQNSQMILKLFQ
jgi:flagellin